MQAVDVIVPCYQYGHFLRECVESVLKQSGPAVRVLIIDDASPDNTAEIGTDLASCDSRVAFTRHIRNQGHITTYNEGLEWVQAPYLLLLSADDYLLPGALCRAVRLMEKHSDVGFTFGNALELSASGSKPIESVSGDDCQVVSGPEFIKMAGASNIVPNPTAVVRTALQRRVGGYRPELPHSGDMELWLRLAAHAKVGMVNHYQAIYRRHRSNMSLEYMASGFLPDVRQRKMALDCFLESCADVLSDPRTLRNTLYRELARNAVGLASTAFDKETPEISEQLSTFAHDICPSVKMTGSWIKYTVRRILGSKTWNLCDRCRRAIF